MLPPSLTSCGSPLYVTEAFSCVPMHSSVVSVNCCPFSSVIFPPAKSRRRISGPFVSSSAATGSPSSFLTLQSVLYFSSCSSCVPCEKLKRATFIPALISLRIISSLSLAGPRVQIIFVFLIYFSIKCIVKGCQNKPGLSSSRAPQTLPHMPMIHHIITKQPPHD